jgi:eukaryotic-like serine/threonine-protein kinase
MADEPRVEQLLDEILDSGRTPEAVCAACPELLPEVRRRWRQMCRVEAELDAIFPTPLPTLSADTLPWHPAAGLPRIPGYEVEAVLGRGGMGIVYQARDLRLGRRVALKMLLAGAYAGSGERQRFLREAEAVAGLRHANIVQVHGAGEHDGRPYFTMEYVEGGSLAQQLAGTPQPARQAAALLATLAEAVQAAHQGGVVHRDLKPANILLTADGTPKIADFGLARHFDSGPALTLSGARVGTPSYMAPEQAIGKAGTIGPAADIYALGAVLYEMLTGRPPFRGETVVETERQVIAEEPVPPARLNPKVPHDLETICLKCLHKDPERRYATAAALADDLRRFQRAEPIAARPAGLPERAGKWVRRHPTPSALLAAGLLLVMLLVGGGLWLVVQQAHLRDAVEADLKEVAGLQERARWAEARAVLERAEARLGGGGPDELRRRLGRARRDLDLVVQLDAIRLSRATRGELVFYKVQADRDYQAAFREAGLGQAHDPPAGVAEKVKASAVRGALVAALDDWAICITDQERRAWLWEVARQADPDPEGWRDRIFDAAAWDDRAALEQLARTVPVAGRSVSLLLALGEQLRAVRGDAVLLLKRVQEEYPADFWANLILGNALLQAAPLEAGGYYRAVLASRPGAAVGYCAVGDALRLRKALGEAIGYYQKALRLDPDYARAHSDLGLALEAQGRLDEALDYYRHAVGLDRNYAWAHHNLANALRVKGRLDEAYEHCQQANELDPNNPEVQKCLRLVLLQQGRRQEAQAVWRKALDADLPGHDAWSGYAELCLFLGQQEEYRRARRALLERFGATAAPFIAEPVGRACLLLPGTPDELRKATALTNRAAATKGVTPGWVYPYFHFARGLAEYRQGRLASAISVMEGPASHVLGPAPRLILALAQHDQGQEEQARRTLAKAVVAFDWSAAQADSRDVWICHVLRREAEAKVLPNLPAFLRGEYQPRDNDERLALVGGCQSRGFYHAAARCYADAFAADPALAEDLTSQCRFRAARGDQQPVGRLEELATECRYPAARCAALAGCGLGEDGAKLSEAERTRWRKQARDWLRADLAMWAKTLDSNSRAARDLAKKMLMRWQADPDLAGLREPGALEKLSADERREYLALWHEVGAALHRTQKTE